MDNKLDEEYLEALEDALLFVRENKRLHQWELNGKIIPVREPFAEKCCTICGAINWGGKEDGICFGNHHAEIAVIAAHNRRASKFHLSVDIATKDSSL